MDDPKLSKKRYILKIHKLKMLEHDLALAYEKMSKYYVYQKSDPPRHNEGGRELCEVVPHYVFHKWANF